MSRKKIIIFKNNIHVNRNNNLSTKFTAKFIFKNSNFSLDIDFHLMYIDFIETVVCFQTKTIK